MQHHKPNILILISSAALLLLLCIQINWILQAAKIKEAMFNEKANMVLAKATEVLATDQVACGQIKASLDRGVTAIGNAEVRKIDSLLKQYMNQYQFFVNYSFVVVKPTTNHFTVRSTNGLSDYVYRRQFETVAGAPQIELKLLLPEKKQFILAEMGPLFFTSVALIIVVLVLFWRTNLSLIKEKTIALHTTEFLNNMAHEFKTPLTNIKLAGTMMGKQTQNPDKQEYYSGIILSENEKLRLRVEQVLSMSALERGEIRLNRVELDVHQLIHETVSCMLVQLENNSGNVELKLNAAAHQLLADRTELSNVLCNLIDNAIKYTPASPHLTIETTNRNHYLIVSIKDNGLGIPEQYRSMVFDKYFRVTEGNVHDVKGVGLGLSYVKKIIELHGGVVEVQSAVGEGTVFSIILPYV